MKDKRHNLPYKWKFSKNRSVDKCYLDIPIKYLTSINYNGSNESKGKPWEANKELCILTFYGKKKALVGWRNTNTYNVSMPKLCSIKWKGNNGYILYKNKEILFTDKNGWVF